MTVSAVGGFLAKLVDFFAERFPRVKVKVHQGYYPKEPEPQSAPFA
jgi:hypothetical protein